MRALPATVGFQLLMKAHADRQESRPVVLAGSASHPATHTAMSMPLISIFTQTVVAHGLFQILRLLSEHGGGQEQRNEPGQLPEQSILFARTSPSCTLLHDRLSRTAISTAISHRWPVLRATRGQFCVIPALSGRTCCLFAQLSMRSL